MATKILLVDDEEDILEILQEWLSEELDGDYVKAFNGEEGFRLALEQKFDLICTDFRMPKLTGAQMILKIRRESHYNNQCPALIISGYVKEVQDSMENTQGVAIIEKPINGDLLLKQARLLLQQ